MGDGVGLVTNQVVEAVCAVSVDEAVANPATCAYAIDVSYVVFIRRLDSIPLIDIADNLESRLGAVLVDLAVLNRLQVILPGESQDVVCVVCG